jgi:GNAT superfamily N-acetyltransferase
MIDTFAWVDDIYVCRAHRAKGISHFILDTINELLRSKLGIKHIVLFTDDAQSLYQKHGYEVFSEPDRQRWMSLPIKW